MDELREKVQNALADDPRTREVAIEILNDNGVIRLSGIVPEPEISNVAESITKGVSGVVSVVNELQVGEDLENDNPFDVPGPLTRTPS